MGDLVFLFVLGYYSYLYRLYQMLMLRLLVLVLLLSGMQLLRAQQAIPFTLFSQNPMQYNPAYAGLGGSLVMVAGYRRQWAQLLESPVSQYLTVHMPVSVLGGGAGLQVNTDRLGAVRHTAMTLSYSMHREIGAGVLTVGMSGGLIQRRLDGQLLRTPTGEYEPGAIPVHYDDLLPVGRERGWMPVIHAGVYYKTDRLELGLGVHNLAEQNLSLPTLRYALDRSFTLQGMYQVVVGSRMVLRPALLVRTDLIQVQTDIAVMMQLEENMTFGLSLRGYSADTGDAVAGMIGFKLSENMTFSYAYDITLSRLRQVSAGSHELVLGYNLNRAMGSGRLPAIIYNPRTL